MSNPLMELASIGSPAFVVSMVDLVIEFRPFHFLLSGGMLLVGLRLYFQQECAQPVSINPIDRVSQMFSKLLFAVSSNCGTPGIQSFAMRSVRAALMAGDIDPDNTSLDLVTNYDIMLMMAMFTGLIVAGVLLLSFS